MTNDKKSPICFANMHMTASESGFYNVLRGISHNKPKLYISCEHVRLRFAGNAQDGRMGKSQAHRLIQRLCVMGWLVLLKKYEKHPETGQWNAGEYKILDHEQWAAKHPEECKRITNALTSGVTVGTIPSEGNGQSDRFTQSPPLRDYDSTQVNESTEVLPESVPSEGNGDADRSLRGERRNALNLGKTSSSIPSGGRHISNNHSSSLLATTATVATMAVPSERNGVTERYVPPPSRNRDELLADFDKQTDDESRTRFADDCNGDELGILIAQRPQYVHLIDPGWIDPNYVEPSEEEKTI